MDSSRVLFAIFWGGGVAVTFAVVAWCRWILWRRHHDRRSFRDFLEGVGLALVAATAAAATGVIIIWPEAVTIRGFFTAVCLGAFFGVGLMMAGDAVESVKRDKR